MAVVEERPTKEVVLQCVRCPNEFIHVRVIGSPGRNPSLCSTCRAQSRPRAKSRPKRESTYIIPTSTDWITDDVERTPTPYPEVVSPTIVFPRGPSDIAQSLDRRLRLREALDESPGTMAEHIRQVVAAKRASPRAQAEALLELAVDCCEQVRSLMRHSPHLDV